MLLTQVDNIIELFQQDTLSGQCPVTTTVGSGLPQLTVLG